MSAQTTLERICQTIVTWVKNTGTVADTAATNSTGSWSVVALLKGIYAQLAAMVAGTGPIHTIVDSGTLTTVTTLTGITNTVNVQGDLFISSDVFTRPADTDPYIALDTIADSTSAPTLGEFTTCIDSTGEGYIVQAKIETNNTALVARFRLHIYNATVTAINDNAPYTLLYADAAKRVGYIDFAPQITEGTGSTGSYSVSQDVRLAFKTANTSLYYILETLDAYTPASGTSYTVSITTTKC